MIVVTGATGRLGRAIIEKLLLRIPADQVGASCRDPSKAADLAARGVRVRKAEFLDHFAFEEAIEGATQVVMIGSNARAYGDDPIPQHRRALEVIRRSGAKHVVYTSHMAASRESPYLPMHDHYRTEFMALSTAVPYTALRSGFYATTALELLAEAKNTGVIRAPADGKIAWTTHQDIAEATVAVLLDVGGFDGPTPPLTTEALDLADLAELASKAWGRAIRREVISDDEYRAELEKRGLPPDEVESALGFYLASRAGEFSELDTQLADLLDGPPTPIASVFS